MKFADINKKFSEAVAEKLANGFQICCNTMSGSQSEICTATEKVSFNVSISVKG